MLAGLRRRKEKKKGKKNGDRFGVLGKRQDLRSYASKNKRHLSKRLPEGLCVPKSHVEPE